MEYRSLGRTGVQVSAFCLGCMNFGRWAEEDESIAVLRRALDAGINFVDTANGYGHSASEEIVGKALKEGSRREKVVLATKVGGGMRRGEPNGSGSSRRHIVQECEDSLRGLQTDYIDLYQIHRPDTTVPLDEPLRALDDLVRSGKVRYVGTSNHPAWKVVESLSISRELGLNRYVSEQSPYNLLDRRIERELVPMALTHGIAILCWAPLASGFLAGRYQRGEALPDDSRLGKTEKEREEHHRHRGDRHHHGRGRRRRKPSRNLLSDAAFDVVDRLREIAAEKGCTCSQLALAWCASQPGVTVPIIGSRTLEQLEDNLAALNLTVTDEDRERLDEVAPPGMVTSRYYEGNFGPHPLRW